MSLHGNASWTEGQDKILVDLWEEGHSASTISRKIEGKSRNAVIGRLHRLRNCAGKVNEPPPKDKPAIKRMRARSLPKAAVRLAGPLRRPLRVLEQIEPPAVVLHAYEVEPDGTPVELFNLCSAACKWAVTSQLPHLFCNKIRRGGSPYCDEHTLKSFSPLKKPARNKDNWVSIGEAASEVVDRLKARA